MAVLSSCNEQRFDSRATKFVFIVGIFILSAVTASAKCNLADMERVNPRVRAQNTVKGNSDGLISEMRHPYETIAEWAARPRPQDEANKADFDWQPESYKIAWEEIKDSEEQIERWAQGRYVKRGDPDRGLRTLTVLRDLGASIHTDLTELITDMGLCLRIVDFSKFVKANQGSLLGLSAPKVRNLFATSLGTVVIYRGMNVSDRKLKDILENGMLSNYRRVRSLFSRWFGNSLYDDIARTGALVSLIGTRRIMTGDSRHTKNPLISVTTSAELASFFGAKIFEIKVPKILLLFTRDNIEASRQSLGNAELTKEGGPSLPLSEVRLIEGFVFEEIPDSMISGVLKIEKQDRYRIGPMPPVEADEQGHGSE